MQPITSFAPRIASRVLVLLLVFGVSLPQVRLRAQEPTPRERELLRELDDARREIERLRTELGRLQGTPSAPDATRRVAPSASDPAPQARTPVAPTPGAAAPAGQGIVLPAAVAEGSRVTAAELLADYRASGLGGDARYKGRRFEVAGTVRTFKKVFASLTWEVELEAGDALGLIRCRVSFPGISDFRGEGTSVLEGRKPFRAWEKLLAKGSPFVVSGRCDGLDGGVIQFRDCRPGQ